VIVALIAATMPLVAVASSAASSRANVIVGVKSIAGFPVSSNFAAAKKLFGAPYSETSSSRVCIARWPGGLSVSFKRNPKFEKWERACLVVTSATGEKDNWRTDKGLRVGASVSQLKKLYPAAQQRGSVWVLVPGSTSLSATLAKGRISGFQITRS
jgi:hypothetical protein